ncbi:MAG: penicillin acylase family protein [Bacteroidota bacterium]|nr:penicillin acylase family protein [Bacteroidota bacterium]
MNFKSVQSVCLAISFTLLFTSCKNNTQESKILEGLESNVEVIRDQYGINHIYAKNQKDLFFAQGYCAASDRLFQFEIWRRQATGTLAEILGERELKRDIGTRLFQFRGDISQELNHYHPDGEEIINAYVDGVNAYIREVLKNPDLLPFEFQLLGLYPEFWTPEVVISRHQGLLGNISQELEIGMAVAKVGTKKVKELVWLHPKDPDITLDPAIRGDLLNEKVLELYKAYRKPVRFLPEDLVEPENGTAMNYIPGDYENEFSRNKTDWISIGSNNWLVGPELTENGATIMANDPHRTLAVPSLRYMVHLVAPGWNVIGGGEPEIPGISIGHNEYGTWGLTVFRTDGEDLYVYDLNPKNLNQYNYQGKWEEMKIIEETIQVKDGQDVHLELKYTRHGPVSYIDSVHFKAYAVRCAWLEPGGSPYLASLRMDQAKTWEEFREACSYSNIPGENMIWADKLGNIGWQAVGIAPVRKNFSGMVPVPGDGRYEWEEYLPILEKPNLLNPESGFFATANQNVTPESYNNWDAITYLWSDPYRGNRVNKVLASGKKFTMDDMKSLQTDYHSIPASLLVPYLKNLDFSFELETEAMGLLQNWNFELDKDLPEAGIYVAWERQIMDNANALFVPGEIKNLVSLQLNTIINFLQNPDNSWTTGKAGRDEFLKDAFIQAINFLSNTYGPSPEDWIYGQKQFKHVFIKHSLSNILNEEWREKINAGPLPRGGNSYTVCATGGNNKQTHGATFKLIIDTGDWDSAIGTNTPGQSGDPDSPFYKNLFELWANDQYFPVYYSKEKIESIEAERLILSPKK